MQVVLRRIEASCCHCDGIYAFPYVDPNVCSKCSANTAHSHADASAYRCADTSRSVVFEQGSTR